MDLFKVILKDKTRHFLIYQLAFIFLVVLVTPFLVDDIIDVIKHKERNLLIVILGASAIILDTVGLIIKARELRAYYDYGDRKRFGRFFFIFWVFRVSVAMFGAFILVIALTGRLRASEGWGMA